MNRRQKRTLLLGLGLVVLLTALLLGVRACKAGQAEKERELQEQERQENLVPTKSDEFQSIAYDNSATNLSFTRDEEGGWIWADDPDFPLDGSYLDQLSGLITNLDPMQTITEGDTLDAYGLDNPSGTLTATAPTISKPTTATRCMWWPQTFMTRSAWVSMRWRGWRSSPL